MTFIRPLFREELPYFLRRELGCVLLLFFTFGITSQAGGQMSPEHVTPEDFGGVEVVHRPHGDPVDKSPGLPQAPGWPQPIAVSGWVDTKGVAFADLDEDGKLEIMAGTSGYRVYVWDYLGNPKPGWPQLLGGTASWGVAVGDVNGDGTLDTAVTAYAPVGRVYVFDPDGNLLPGWPVSFGDNRACLCPTLSDLDGDGKLEIIVGERSYSVSYAHVFRYDGTEFPGNWPFALDHYPGTGAAVGDIDNDGEKEIIYCSLQTIYALESDGSIMPGWPYTAPTLAFYQNAPALADFEGDGYAEIVCSGTEWNRFFVMDHRGNFLPGWPRPAPRSGGPPSVGDVDQDGDLDIAIGNYPPSYPGVVFHVLDIEANCLPGFPLTLYGGAEGPVSIADFDGDSTMELIFENGIAVDSIGFL
ncbi:MAG: hypothetical protein GTO24_22895, partial [candidate division Zixibacteria bacterium]|nr:hypothetical protein [candidate division Zixibacteria bacterium]